jgi:hypothetical protein
MTNQDQAIRNVSEWLATCQTRFKNMYDADLDKNGWPALQKALKNYEEKGYFTVGEITYLFNRTHPKGTYADYNTHKGYDKKFGSMMTCPLKDLIDSNLVNWRTGANGVMQPSLASAIKAETSWEFRMGNLRAQHNTAFSDLFGA